MRETDITSKREEGRTRTLAYKREDRQGTQFAQQLNINRIYSTFATRTPTIYPLNALTDPFPDPVRP